MVTTLFVLGGEVAEALGGGIVGEDGAAIVWRGIVELLVVDPFVDEVVDHGEDAGG